MKKIKAIFLDIDGVMNQYTIVDGEVTKFTPVSQTEDGLLLQMDQELVFRLNKLVDRTGVELVLSSTWRIARPWRETMKANGIVKDFLDRTPRLPRLNGTSHEYCERGKEIKAWLDEHPEVEDYVIIDDDSDFLPEQKEGGHFFQTDMRKGGLTQEIADAVEKYLGDK